MRKKYQLCLTIVLLILFLAMIGGCSNISSVKTSDDSDSIGIVYESTPQHRSEKQTKTSAGEQNKTNGEKQMNSDEQQILALFRKRCDAMTNKDTEYLRSVMGKTVRHITGRTQTIDEWLDDVQNERMKYYNIEIKDPVITISGDTAVLQCTSVIKARIYGSNGTWSLPSESNYQKINGVWQNVVPLT